AAAIEGRGAQKAFAERLSVSEPTLSLWVNGWVPEQWEKLRRVCEASGVSADDLLGLPRASATTPPADSSAPIPQVWVPLIADVAAGEAALSPRDEAEDWYA